ncbi:MAG: amino acid permease, partial [Selenomonadaceae bacterium]|nr:amino acid permease [Selenomonadaceae bacterium]
LVFYVGTMAVLMALWPWNLVGKEASPFVQIFVNVGIPAAAHILNFVVLMAAVSVYNSAIYSNSRMLYRLAEDGNAPAFLRRLSSHGVPVTGIFVSSGITLLAVVLNYFFPKHAFMYMLSIATCAAVITWVSIAITHLKFRRYCREHSHATRFRALLYPFGNYLCLAFFAGIIALMAQIPDMQMAVIVLPVWLLVLWIGFRCKH